MTNCDKSVTRRSLNDHPRHKRKIVCTLGPGDVLGLRLEREKTVKYLPLDQLYDMADMRAAAALTGYDTSPCANPKKRRIV
jgi:hypothetical protein